MNKKSSFILIVYCTITSQTLIPSETTANPAPEHRSEWLFSVCCPWDNPKTERLSSLCCVAGYVCYACCCCHWNHCDCGCCPKFCYRLPCCFDGTDSDSERDLIREQRSAGSRGRQTRITTLMTTEHRTEHEEEELKKLARENPALHQHAVDTTQALAIQGPQPVQQEMNA